MNDVETRVKELESRVSILEATINGLKTTVMSLVSRPTNLEDVVRRARKAAEGRRVRNRVRWFR